MDNGISRREYFQAIVGATPETPSNEEPDDQVETNNAKEISRRSFLKLLGALAAGFALEQARIPSLEAEEKTPPIPSSKTITPESTHAETALEQVLASISLHLFHRICTHYGIKEGNYSKERGELERLLMEKPVETMIKECIAMPALEELLYRAFLSSSIIDKKDKTIRWDVGVPISALFAVSHNFRQDEDYKTHFVKDSVPLSQFFSGLLYWHFMRERGVDHAILAHSLNNAIPISIGAYLYNKYPKAEADQIVEKIFGKDLDSAEGTRSLKE